MSKNKAAAPQSGDGEITAVVDVLTACSGEGWAAAKGRHECPADRAAMLIARGYARAIETAE